MKQTWTQDAIHEFIESHDENVPVGDYQLAAMFRAVYGRNPEEDERIDMWSHICAGVSHA